MLATLSERNLSVPRLGYLCNAVWLLTANGARHRIGHKGHRANN
jgi:hypothetical protein